MSEIKNIEFDDSEEIQNDTFTDEDLEEQMKFYRERDEYYGTSEDC